MLPIQLLQQLSPAATKLFLALITLVDPERPTIQVPITHLAHMTALSPRTCKTALAQLASLGLLKRLPRHYHAPNTYLLTEPPQGQPAAPEATTPTLGQPIAPVTNPSAPPTRATRCPSDQPHPIGATHCPTE